jgi:hypothetical protein
MKGPMVRKLPSGSMKVRGILDKPTDQDLDKKGSG